jgi:hypothetical protein
MAGGALLFVAYVAVITAAGLRWSLTRDVS